MGKTLYDKIWNEHAVMASNNGTSILYVDRHFIHEVTSPQAFTEMRKKKRVVRMPELTMATLDHCNPTIPSAGFANKETKAQADALRQNCNEFNIELFDVGNPGHGIVHIIAPESGKIMPGMMVVCGDSHTSTHGAFGALAFGIGTSEVEHVFSTQTLQQKKSKNFLIKYLGEPQEAVFAKDIALFTIGRIGAKGGTGSVIEYQGKAIERLSMEGRMTLCNMSIECGARAGLIAPDNTTFDYLREKLDHWAEEKWEQAYKTWCQFGSDDDSEFDRTEEIDIDRISPQVTWGTSPEQVIGIDEAVPTPNHQENDQAAKEYQRALDYMGLKPGIKMTDVGVDVVFIGSCTNGRIEDFREAAKVIAGKKVKAGVKALAVPGSMRVKMQVEEEGLDKVFTSSGFEWREPGCSMCLAMNGDELEPGQRSASTSNRNFEGRQGDRGRTHLVSPAMAAAAAIEGRFTDVREFI